MKSKASLASALSKVAGSKENSRKPPATGQENGTTATTNVAPSRRGKKAIGGFFDPAVSRQLKQLGIDHDKSVQDLLAEALNGLFQKWGKPPIA